MFLKVAFFAGLIFLVLEYIVFSHDKKLRRALGYKTSVDFRKGVGRLGKMFLKYFNRKEVEKRLNQAGNPWGLSIDSFVGLKILSPCVMAGIQLYLRANLYYLLVVSFFCFFLPDVLLVLVTNDRKRMINKELPDVVDIFESAAESGIDVGTAFNLAAEYVTGKALKKELSLLSARYAVTKDKENALLDFKDNADIYDVDLLVLALLQDTRTGKAKEMLQSLAHSQSNKMLAVIEKEGKAVEYRVLLACSFMAVTIAALVFYPYFSILDAGLHNIFN